MAETNSLRGDTVIETLVNMSSSEMRGETVTETFANITDEDPADDFIGAVLAYAGASDDLRGATVIETIRNILEDSGSTEDVPNDVIGALLMLNGGGGGDSGIEKLIAEALMCSASDALSKPLLGATVYGKSTQDGTPTPSAPVAIESVDSVALRLSGQSIWGGFAMHDDVHAVIPAATDGTNEHGNYVSFSAAHASGKRLFENAFKPDTQYTFILSVGKSNTSGNVNLRIYYTDGTYTNVTRTSTDSDGTPDTVAPVSTSGKTVEVFRGVNSSGTTYLYYDQCAVLEGVHTAEDFEPYIGTTTAIDLDGHELRSLPDGTRDELTVDAEGHVTLVQRVGSVDLGTLTWGYSSNTDRVYTTGITSVVVPAVAGMPGNILCEAYESLRDIDTINHVRDKIMSMTTGGVVSVYDTTYTNGPDFKAAMDGVTLIYPLATPVTHDLGTVAMPTAPSPDFNVLAVTSMPTTLSVKYLAASE